MAEIDVLLHGDSLRTDIGSPAFCSITLIRGKKLILVDSGHVGRRSLLVEALAERGLTPADIDVAVLTHAHWDHAQNFDLFPNAPLLLHGHELRYARRPHRNDWATPRWTAAMLEYEGRVQTIEEGHEIEPGIRIMHTPGHSAGTIAVIVDTPHGRAAVTGDGIQYASVALTRVNPLVFWSEEDARKSIGRVLEAADTIYPGHDRPFRLLKDGGAEYLVPKHLTLGGIDLEDPGVSVSMAPRLPVVMKDIEEQTLE